MTPDPKDYTGSESTMVGYYVERVASLKKFSDNNKIDLDTKKRLAQQKLNEHEFKLKLQESLGTGLDIVGDIQAILGYPLAASEESKAGQDLHTYLNHTGNKVIIKAVHKWINSTWLIIQRRSSDGTTPPPIDFLKSERYLLNPPKLTSATELKKLGRHIDTLETIIKQLEEAESKHTTIISPSTSPLTIAAEIKLTGNVVTLWLSNVGTIPLKPLRTDGPQFNFMKYILARPDTNISRGEVQTNIEGCEDLGDLTEIVRYCGFDKQLKKSFFTHCTQHHIQFKSTIELPSDTAEKFIEKYKS